MNWAGLVARIKAGEASAGPELVSLLGPQLDLYCARIAPYVSTLNRENAVEMALANVVRKIDKYDQTRATLPVWARAFVRNALREILNSNREDPRANEDLARWLEVSAERNFANTDGPDLDEDETHPALPATHVALLSILLQFPDDADLLYAHAVEGLPFTVLAERMSYGEQTITPAALRKRYQRAREKVIAAAKGDENLRHLAEEDNP